MITRIVLYCIIFTRRQDDSREINIMIIHWDFGKFKMEQLAIYGIRIELVSWLHEEPKILQQSHNLAHLVFSTLSSG